MPGPRRPLASGLRQLRLHLAEVQHRSAYYLALNNVLGAATGFLFWLLLARVGGLSTAVVGVGYSTVALGTVMGVVGKGGLDTALLQKVPGASHAEGRSLLRFAALVGGCVATGLTALLALAALVEGWLPDLTPTSYALVAIIAVLLVLSWLQDAYFLALGKAQLSFRRNVALSIGRLALPIPVIALALANPVPLTWTLALGVAALVGMASARHLPDRAGRHVPRPELLRSALHNISGGAAEFLPGLLLVPLVLALDGPEAAAFFGIAWTSASLAFQTSGAIGRSALAQMIQGGPAARAPAIRKGVLEHLLVVLPLAVLMGLFAPEFLALFGKAYAARASEALAILCVSTLVIAPISLYLAVLRSGKSGRALSLFPLAMIASLAVWAPLLGARYGLNGVAIAWAASNAPFGAYATWRLRHAIREVMPLANPAPVLGRADLE
jgi:O-antigen/teichoic acid export membrane protein